MSRFHALAAPVLCAIGAVAIGACQTPPEGPAVLTDQGVEAARAALSDALGRALVEFGEPSPTTAPVVVVLPPRPGPYEGRSLAVTIRYDIALSSQGCRLLPREGGTPLVLPAGSCIGL